MTRICIRIINGEKMKKRASDNSNPSSNPSEAHEQKQLIQWCRTDPRFQYLFHVPNESVGGPGWLTRNRQMGVKAGVPDLIYPVPMKGYHGLFIEMKTKTGRLSAEQKRWIAALETFGYKVVVVHGWEQAKEALQDYVR